MEEKIAELFDEAVRRHVSVIYLLPSTEGYEISFSIASAYVRYQKISVSDAQHFINFLKFKGDMALSERRRPQLGAWVWEYEGEQIFCRFSCVGTFLNYETMVIRLIYSNFTNGGGYFFDEQFKEIEQACQKKGLIVFAGPMGSGKTTAMYHFAKKLRGKLVMTIEDPVEIYEPQFLQLQVNNKALMSYENLLTAALRLHPDVFVIGEIRNETTAAIALRAALSGHLVLSTVHAQSVYGVFFRLLNLGTSKFDLTQILQLVSYQRLIETTHDDVKVLFDILSLEKTSWDEISQMKRGEMTDDWGKRLEQCERYGEITSEIRQKYLQG